ncbi:MAG: DUF1987 domain-containing protein [Flavobacteriales bacterium]
MTGLQITGTKDSPSITLHPGSGMMEIQGRSFPEDSFAFYEKILEWINKNPGEFASGVHVNFFLTYVNSTSAIMLSRMLGKLKEFASDKTVKVNWKYYVDDESLEELGYKLSETSGIAFDFSPVDEE